MKTIIALLFLAAVVVYAEEETEYHPQAILHYLEMEDQEMARKVRSYLEPRLVAPTVRPQTATASPAMKRCIAAAVKCHKKAGDDACKHLRCISRTSRCLRRAGMRPTPQMRKCFPVIRCCMLYSKTCEERLCCFVRFAECLKRLGDKKDAA
ncbi:uncharacterized protein LOC144654920 isoform X2 [Oculina patagonica]